MQPSIRTKAVLVPSVPIRVLAPVATAGAFGWLLAHDAIQPLAVYLLQLFLSF